MTTYDALQAELEKERQGHLMDFLKLKSASDLLADLTGARVWDADGRCHYCKLPVYHSDLCPAGRAQALLANWKITD